MNNKVVKSIVAGIAGTVIMTVVMKVAGMLGMPTMDPPAMMANLLGMPLAVGFVMHFLIGIVFAAMYVYLFNPKVPISNTVVKGALFGVAAFIFAQIPMSMMGDVAAPPEGASMALVAVAGVVGHVVFGIGVALFAKNRA